MVGLVLVSHSRSLALATQELVRTMTGPALPLAVAAGVGENHAELGTDAVEISEAIRSVQSPDGVVVLMDMGSAILSSETALEFLDEHERVNVRFCPAPFVEGAVAAGVTAGLGASLGEVCAEAVGSLKQKGSALGGSETVPLPAKTNGNGHAAPPAHFLRLTVRNAHGLHARPAARLIGGVKRFQAEISARNATNRRGPVPLKSLSGLASLEILQNHDVEFSAAGPDADVALDKIREMARQNFGDPPVNGKAPSNGHHAAPATGKTSGPVPISGGLAIGPAFQAQTAAIEVPRHPAEDVDAEIARLREAVDDTVRQLEARRVQIGARAGAENGGIYEAQILALQDPELTDAAARTISDEHQNAAQAWSEASLCVEERYASLRDPYLRERAADIADVGRQVLARLTGATTAAPVPAEPSVIIADDLTPGQVSALDRERTLGVILLDGGPTAHASILLKALGFPAVVQARSALAGAGARQPQVVALDGTTGKIWLDPDPGTLGRLQAQLDQQREREREEHESTLQPGATADGRRIEIFANIGSAAEAARARDSGAEGVGLLRTEFLFLERDSAPTEEEQVEVLSEIAAAFAGKPVIVRTLDIGGDKDVPYLHRAAEANPFLGVRALRLCFEREELFATQLRAILRAGLGHDLRIMFPMVADAADLDRARACLDRAHAGLEQAGIAHAWPIQAGIMIEIPAAALQAERLAASADFFSIGTNDLTQYTLAADRGNPELAPYQDSLHPAVLRLIEQVVRGAQTHHRPVAVCGEAASDAAASLVLVGLGVTELSVAASQIPRLKASLRRQSFPALQDLAARALACASAAEVRVLAES
jgi:phosphocarrier protein FPr